MTKRRRWDTTITRAVRAALQIGPAHYEEEMLMLLHRGLNTWADAPLWLVDLHDTLRERKKKPGSS